MNIIIEHFGTKRIIEGDGFNICGDGDELKFIANQILQSVACDPRYGWHQIRDKRTDQHTAPNCEPLNWS